MATVAEHFDSEEIVKPYNTTTTTTANNKHSTVPIIRQT